MLNCQPCSSMTLCSCSVLLLHVYSSRVEARSEQLDMYMQLDVATDVYPMHAGEKFNMVLAPTLNLDGTPDTGYYTQVINLAVL